MLGNGIPLEKVCTNTCSPLQQNGFGKLFVKGYNQALFYC